MSRWLSGGMQQAVVVAGSYFVHGIGHCMQLVPLLSFSPYWNPTIFFSPPKYFPKISNASFGTQILLSNFVIRLPTLWSGATMKLTVAGLLPNFPTFIEMAGLLLCL
jgi:hypothetical protein